MAERIMGPARLEAFSDGVVAIIITIMVLELKVPTSHEPAALLAVWPTFLAYLLSFLMVAIYWVNHHALFHYCRSVDIAVLWTNIAFLFCPSLIPFSTAHMGDKRFARRAALVALVAPIIGMPCDRALAWGQEGHSIVAEIAQQRLSPRAAAVVARTLGRGRSLASIASWADDVRDKRPWTARWHFVDIPLAENRYVPEKHCAPSPEGDCVIAELERLKRSLACGRDAAVRQEALKFAVHFVGDLHQPLHTIDEEKGGNLIPVQVHLRGLVCSQACKAPLASNFHAAWDSDLIHATVWNWGAYVDRLEAGWLRSTEARRLAGAAGTPVDWALRTHAAGQTVWKLLPEDRVLGDEYFQKALPVLDRQLGLAGLRLARFLNEAFSPGACRAFLRR